MNFIPIAELIQLRPNQCPNYQSCSAPLCPLDPGWFRCKYLKGEPICFYLKEAQKPGARFRFETRIEQEIYRACCINDAPMKAKSGALRRKLERASKTKSRRESFDHAQLTDQGGSHERQS